MATTEILPFVTNAPGTGNVLSQAAYVALTSIRANGYTADSIAESDLVNKVQRQSSFMAAGLANFCVAQGISVPDDANLSGLVTNITNALKALLLTRSNNLSDLTNVVTARANLGLGTAAVTASSAYDPAGAASAVQALALLKANNLSDLTNKATARASLQLGTAALADNSDFDAAGTATAAVAALQALVLLKANNLSDLPNKVTARANLQLGTAALNATGDFDAAGTAALRLLKSANLSDLSNVVAARSNLGLGTASVQAASAFDAAGAATAALNSAKAYTDSSGFGPSINTHNVAGSRTIGTVFTNTRTKAIFVSVTGGSTADVDNLRLLVDIHDGNGFLTTALMGQQVHGSAMFVSGLVPVNADYKVVFDAGAISPAGKTWNEAF